MDEIGEQRSRIRVPLTGIIAGLLIALNGSPPLSGEFASSSQTAQPPSDFCDAFVQIAQEAKTSFQKWRGEALKGRDGVALNEYSSTHVLAGAKECQIWGNDETSQMYCFWSETPQSATEFLTMLDSTRACFGSVATFDTDEMSRKRTPGFAFMLPREHPVGPIQFYFSYMGRDDPPAGIRLIVTPGDR
jgi:hypothetical protein